MRPKKNTTRKSELSSEFETKLEITTGRERKPEDAAFIDSIYSLSETALDDLLNFIMEHITADRETNKKNYRKRILEVLN